MVPPDSSTKSDGVRLYEQYFCPFWRLLEVSIGQLITDLLQWIRRFLRFVGRRPRPRILFVASSMEGFQYEKFFSRPNPDGSRTDQCASHGPATRGSRDPEDNAVPIPAAFWLFVQTVISMTFEGNTLTLKGVAAQTLMFADRPERMTGDAATGKFVSFWTSGKSDFEKDPPNATLSVTVEGTPQLAVVGLTNPKLKGDTLTYTVKLLDGTPSVTGQPATLFIDWWYGPGRGPRHYWHAGPWGLYGGGRCWRGPYGGLYCRPAWGY